MLPYVQQLNKLWTKWSHLFPPTPTNCVYQKLCSEFYPYVNYLSWGGCVCLPDVYDIHQCYLCSLAGVHDSLRRHLEGAGQQLCSDT